MDKNYILEKGLWTDNDFDVMSWHDNPIHAISFTDNFQLVLDIDYIFKWVLKGKYYNFWMSPCTLVFENVCNIKFELDSTEGCIITDITRENPQRPKNAEYIKRELEYDWCIELVSGEIFFNSAGYTQYVRQQPKLISKQKLELESRGGISFSTTELIL